MNSEKIQSYEGIVRSLVQSGGVRPHDVEDLVQDVMLSIVEDPCVDLASEMQWLRKRILNVLRNYRPTSWPPRIPSRVPKPSELAKKLLNIPYDGKPVEEVVEEWEIKTHLNQAAKHLSEPYRSAVRLYFYENMPLEKTAGRMGFSVEHIHTLIEQSVDLLRAKLQLSRN